MQLLKFKTKDLLPITQIILSRKWDSDKLSVNKNVFSNNRTEKDYYLGQAYLDFILDASTNYVVQIKLEQQSGQPKCFAFGLMRESDKDTAWGGYEKLCYDEKRGRFGLNTLVKGTPILTNDNSFESRSLEVRINIQRRILRVGSLPNYESVVQADKPETIDPAIPYQFFLIGLRSGTKMTIVKLQSVSQFDYSM